MYNIYYSTSRFSRTILYENIDTFGKAKENLIREFNRLMYQGIICYWTSNVSFVGKIQGIETTFYIKKK